MLVQSVNKSINYVRLQKMAVDSRGENWEYIAVLC
jgi:hypothetical protein